MESTSTVLEVLGDLLKINRDRVEGYKKASYNTSDAGLKALFSNMADQARMNVTDIMREIIQHKGSIEAVETTRAGKLYQVWETFKGQFSNHSIKNVLTLCESREAEAMNIYQKAKNKSFGNHLNQLIEQHAVSLKSSHEVIKVYKQAYTNVGKMHS
jgi:uncharacterized protein (TIGR02284 family)